VRFLVDSVGADQVLLGSDQPFPLSDQDPVGTIREAALDGPTTEAVLGGNALRLLTGGHRG
jgi:aminocarboxymuconate-semialdehyde decarboxylase